EATRTFFSPVVVHFSTVFFLACIALVPGHRAAFFAVLMAAAGIFGLCVAARLERPGRDAGGARRRAAPPAPRQHPQCLGPDVVHGAPGARLVKQWRRPRESATGFGGSRPCSICNRRWASLPCSLSHI